MLVTYDYVMVGGGEGYLDADADFPVALWHPRVFGMQVAGDPRDGIVWAFRVSDVPAQGFEHINQLMVGISVIRPLQPMVVVDEEMLAPQDDAEMEADRLAMIEAMETHGVTVAGPDALDAGTWRAQGYLVLNHNGEEVAEGVDALTGLATEAVGIDSLEIDFAI